MPPKIQGVFSASAPTLETKFTGEFSLPFRLRHFSVWFDFALGATVVWHFKNWFTSINQSGLSRVTVARFSSEGMWIMKKKKKENSYYSLNVTYTFRSLKEVPFVITTCSARAKRTNWEKSKPAMNFRGWLIIHFSIFWNVPSRNFR